MNNENKAVKFKKIKLDSNNFSTLQKAINEKGIYFWSIIEETIKTKNKELINHLLNSLYHKDDKWVDYFHFAIKKSLINHDAITAKCIIDRVTVEDKEFFYGLNCIFGYDVNEENVKIFTFAYEANEIELLSVMLRYNIACLNNFQSIDIYKDACKKGKTKLVKLFLQKTDLSDFYTDNLFLVNSHLNVTKLLFNDERYQLDFCTIRHDQKALSRFNDIFDLFSAEYIAERFVDIMKFMHDLKNWFQGPMQTLSSKVAQHVFNNPLILELINNSTTEDKNLLQHYRTRGFL